MKPLPLVREDTLPENGTYKDDGCEVALHCLTCPLEHCKYDSGYFGQRQAYERARRHRQIARLRDGGVSMLDLMRTYGISSRTIHRVTSKPGRRSTAARIRRWESNQLPLPPPRMKLSTPPATIPGVRKDD